MRSQGRPYALSAFLCFVIGYVTLSNVSRPSVFMFVTVFHVCCGSVDELSECHRHCVIALNFHSSFNVNFTWGIQNTHSPSASWSV